MGHLTNNNCSLFLISLIKCSETIIYNENARTHTNRVTIVDHILNNARGLQQNQQLQFPWSIWKTLHWYGSLEHKFNIVNSFEMAKTYM